MDRDSEIKLALKSMDEGMRDKLKTLSLYSTERYVGGKITITPKMVQDIYDSIDDEREGDMFDCGLAVINLMVRKRDAFFLMKSNIEKGYNGVRLNLELLKEKEQTLEVINALYEVNPDKAKELASKFNEPKEPIRFKLDNETNKYVITAMPLSSVVAASRNAYISAMMTAKTLAMFFDMFIEEYDVADFALKEIFDVIEDYKKDYSIKQELFDLYFKYCLFGTAREKAEQDDYIFMPSFEQSITDKKANYKNYFKVL